MTALTKFAGVLLTTLTITAAAQPQLTTQQIIDGLQLEAHVEGGYFRRTYQADHRQQLETNHGERYLLTSIFYLLTADAPVGHFHKNRSDILHFYQAGDPIRYTLIMPDGQVKQVVMATDLAAGQQLQLTVKGGIWKSSELLAGEHGYGLISEAVSPGFDFEDMTLANEALLNAEFPQHQQLIKRFSKHQ
ncbi:cupin domain-containing protein [Neiella marina]|uniref:Cupin domain-containing protein n=1 Tax=Neiella holothuriorum TaxID=2870530 RepID=A0ABS7ECY8_9GAMM|nr:cupin domain-containing protein [Neiella holothuriorum]MBW8189788.1 cupin domain-containing protein [Neiella holothuriorum]